LKTGWCGSRVEVLPHELGQKKWLPPPVPVYGAERDTTGVAKAPVGSMTMAIAKMVPIERNTRSLFPRRT
jgi:hypothetical protein